MKKIILIGTAVIGFLVSAKPASTVLEEHPKSYTEGVLVKCPHCSHYLPKPSPSLKLTAKERASFAKEAKNHMKVHVELVHGKRKGELEAARERVNAVVAKSSRKPR